MNSRELSLPATSTRMLRADASTPHQTPRTQASIDLQSSEDAPLAGWNVDAAICLALARCGLSHEQACLLMGVDQSLWTKQRKGEGHVSLQRLLKLPQAFWFELLAILSAPLGITIAHPDMTHVALVRVMELAGEVARLASVQQTLRRAG